MNLKQCTALENSWLIEMDIEKLDVLRGNNLPEETLLVDQDPVARDH